jgi:putative ABC transport system substrate-binding protein
MNRKLLWLLTVLLLTCVHIAEAQQPKKIRTIGIPSTPPAALNEAFKQGLRDLGYVVGQNILIEQRYPEGKLDRLTELAAELVRLKVDAIFVGSTPPALVAKKATQTIPIVFAGASDPVGSGLVASLARPGGNVTGLSLVPGLEISGKQLELLKEALPKLTHLAVLADATNPPTQGFLREAERAAPSLGIKLQVQNVRADDELDGALSATKKGRADALLVIPSPMVNRPANRRRIVSFAANGRLPAMYPYSDFIDSGGLVSYGPNLPDLFHRAATYVDKIFKGAKPADLPVEQPTKFELVINLKAGKQIGITIPPNVLARADRVIR